MEAADSTLCNSAERRLSALLGTGSVDLVCKGGLVRAHRDILFVASPVMRGLLESEESKGGGPWSETIKLLVSTLSCVNTLHRCCVKMHKITHGRRLQGQGLLNYFSF